MQKISRRKFVQASAVASLGTHPWSALAKGLDTKKLLLAGTQTSGTSKGIYAYAFDSATGELTQTGLAVEADSPTFLALAPNGRTLIAANELDQYEGKKSGAVSSFTLDRKTSRLTKVNTVSAQGDGTCHVSLDHTGRCAFAANYGGGSAASFSVSSSGQLSPAVSFFQYTGHGPEKQQKGPRGHRVTVSPDNRFLLVNDLGLDAIHIYRLDAATAKLIPSTPSEWKAAPGSGPRALIFHPNGKWAYCVNDLAHTGGPPGPVRSIGDRHGPAGPFRLRREPAGRLHGKLHDLTGRRQTDPAWKDIVRWQDPTPHRSRSKRGLAVGGQPGDG
jgi:6-phosphogluconolactonase